MKLHKNYEYISGINSGTFGTVWKAVSKSDTTKVFAIKVNKELAIDEVDLLRESQGQHVVELFEDLVTEENKHIIVMEYCPLDLFDFLKYKKMIKISLGEMRHIWWQIASGIKHIHDLGIMHRDVKLENILVTSGGDCKLADFGWACEHREEELQDTDCGTASYNAPEILYEYPFYDYKVDTWSMGIVFAELYLDHPVIESYDNEGTIAELKQIFGENKMRQSLFPNLSKDIYPDNSDIFRKIPLSALEKDTEKKMAENPNNRLQKFNGSKSAIRPESWIKLYDFENNSLKEDEKIKNLMYYLTDSALEWYADEIISNPAVKRWEVVKEKLIQRFGSYNANPIVSASHRRLKREESIENYFQDKIRLLNQTHLTKEEKIHLLTDGLPNDWKDLIVAAQPTDTTKWFHIAASIEQNRASIQFKPKNKIHLATKNNDNRKNVCPFWCPICSKKGIKIKHWVTDCEDYDPNYKKDRPNQNTSVKQVCGAPELLNVSTLTNTPTQGAFKLINISVEVNGIPAQAFVDTGATVSIINWRLFKRTRLQLQPNSDIHISQADGVTRTCGSLQTKVRIDKLIKPVTLHVMKNFKYPLLIGLDVASLFNLLIDVKDKTIYTKFDGLQNPILVNHLEEIREHELKELLEHNRNVFSQHAIDLGKVAIQHKIITKSEQPISLRPYRRPLKEYEEIAEQVKELLEHKLIRISDSPWAFPIVMVPKKDGNKRMCIDYRRLNEITLDDRQPLPHIQDMFDRLHGSRFFSTLDVAWGYWQIEMDPQSIQKTAFVTNDGHYEFLVMPFGLKNAASTFQRIIQHILGELLWKGTCSFQDDILVYTKTWQEHIELLSKVFDKLRQYNMKLKLSKCIFGRTEVKYLGHIISHNQLKPDPGKVKSIQDFPRPDTVKKVRQFMGLANYYRKFVKDFSKISFPLVRLTRKNQPFIWNEEVEESFAKLKMALSTKPVLAIYNPDYPSKVYTDASKYGIGAILTQIGPDNEEHVIAYYSKTLQPHQENYSAYEMECLAVIQATDHFHVYIENQPFEIITDHAALQWLFTMKKPKPKYFRWILSLSSKSCNIVHRSGKQQTHVDALSRLPVVNIATQELQEHQQNSDLSFLKNSHTHDGVVMIKQKGIFKAVVPNSLTKKILEEYHDSLSHPSITKTCKLITQCYWWKGITTDIKNYVRSCKSCQLVKVRHEPTLGEMITPTSNIQPLQMIGCDTIVLGTAAANTKHKFIQVFVDHATRYLWAYPTITNTAQAVTQCLDKIIKSVNSINTILTDNGKNFISKEFNKFLSLQGIKHTYTSPYHPQCNGICEKLNDTIMTKLRIAVLEKPRCKWSSLLPQVVKNYNSTPHDVTGFSPLFLMYGIGNVPEFADQTPITIEEARKKASLRTEQSRSEVASADEEAARKYPEKLAKIIKDGGYCAHQIFNADETGLFWKKMPTRTYIAKSEKNASGFKAAKYRVTLLLCSNASGDRMLKPLLVNRSLKPHHVALAIAEIKSQTLNACWKAAWPECVSKINESNRTTRGGEGFDDFCEHDIEELLVDEALNDDDILESMVDTTKDFETVDSELEDVTPLDEKLLREGLQLSGKLEIFFIQNDNDVERALKFQRDLKFCMSGYRELYKELVKPSQRLITNYLVKEKKSLKFLKKHYHMVETRSGKMQDTSEERLKTEESAKPQPSATIGRDASADPVVLNPNIDIPKYDGTEDPRPWIESLEEIGFLYHWAEYIIYRYAAMNMIGSAKTWLDLHKISFTSWEHFKSRLIQDFGSDANKEELKMRLNRMQQWNEPAIRFAEDILVLCNKVDPQMEEEYKINWVIGGLKKEYSFALYLNPPKNTNELLRLCKKMDLASIEAEDGEYVIEENNRMTQTNGLRLARSLLTVTDKKTHIWITNPYPRPLKIMKDQTLAYGSLPAGVNFIENKEKQNENDEIQFQLNKNLTFKEQERLKQILAKYTDLFSSRLGRTSLAKHQVHTEDAKPIKHKPYRVSAKERTIIKDQIDEMLEEGIIRQSSSPWSFPVILVKKRDGKYRFCVDYRKLNEVTVKDVYPIPRIDDVMDTLQGSKYFSAIDLKSGYWQVEIEERDKEKTAFTTAHGLYEFNVMPFGLCNAPATFERNMDNVLGNLRWQICLCYLDDVIIYSSDFPTHIKRLEAVLRCFSESNLKLNAKKCRFAFEELEILGHITNQEGIKPAEYNIKAVRDFPQPKKAKEVQSFLGMCSYYRKFIKDFSLIADPLTSLIRKNVQFIWTGKQEEAFQNLKKALMNPPILGHFDPNAATCIHTDASNIGLGATLIQNIGGEEKVISYLSRTLSKPEQNYSTTEKECLAVVWSISKLRPYLYGRHFKIVTDHHALCWLKNLKDPTGRLARWALKIQEYNFEIIHKSGKKHLDADGLSRGPLPENEWDEDYERLFLNQIIDEKDDFIENIKTCHLCQSRKGSNQLPSGLLQPIPPANYPFERIGIDFVGPLPSTKRRRKWIIVLTDYYTKYAETKAVPEATVKEVSTFLIEHIFLRHGAPRFLISDRGSQFTSNLMKEVMKMCKVKHCFTTSYHPQTNGLTERLNRTLINMISMYVNTDQKNWDEILPFITHAYNTTIQETTGYSPFFLLFGREPMSLLDDENIPTDSNMDDYDEYIENYLDKIARRRDRIFQGLISTLQLVERLDRYPLRNKRKFDSVEPEETSMNVKKEGAQVSNYVVQHLPRNPSIFSGEDGEDLQKWLKGYARVAKYNHWDETLCLTKVYFYLSGTALKWFENNEESIQTWKEFTSQLENVFGKKENSKLQAEKKLKTRAQLKGESTEFYIQDVLCLCKEVDPQMSEEDKISHLMKGIAEELYQALLPRDVQSTEQFITECRRVEALRCRRVTPTRYERLPNVASLRDHDDRADLSSMIRQMVREEVQRALASPREEPEISAIKHMVQQEIEKTIAPISRSFPQNRAMKPYLNPEDQEDHLEEDPEDDSTNFQEEDIPTERTQQPQTRVEISGPITRSRALRLRMSLSRIFFELFANCFANLPFRSQAVPLAVKMGDKDPTYEPDEEAFKVSHGDLLPSPYEEAISNPDSTLWRQAINKEIHSLKDHHVWNLIELTQGAKPIKSKWVFSKKFDLLTNKEIFKARLVALGCSQKYGTDYNETFSPVMKTDSFRTLLAYVTMMDYEFHHFDVETAFLYGKLTETIYINQPEGYQRQGKDIVCKLNQALYGIKQSGRI
ncbi:hypothetical protein LAZ67_3000918, partial [Cordylochernes scorpioides]